MATTVGTPSSPPARPARRRLAASERRAQLLDAAAREFGAHGYAATSVAAVARAGGVTPRILYRHFPSKDALYRAVLDRTAERLTTVFAEPDGRYGVDPAGLLTVGRADPDGFRALWRHAAHEPSFRAVAQRCRDAAVDCATRALSPWTPEDAVAWAARAVVGYELESVLTWLDHGRPADDARFARATRAALAAGVRAWSDAGPA